MNILLLMMGGSGTRLGADIPKQYILIDEKPIFSYILDKYNKMDDIDKIIIVSHADWIDYVKMWRDKLPADKVTSIVCGGDTRSESVRNGLSAAESFAGNDDIVLIHDATHPYVDSEGTQKVIDAAAKYGGATLASFNYDTVYRMDENNILSQVVPRKEIVSGASPEAFTFNKIYNIYMNSSGDELESMTSAGAIALAYGIEMYVVEAGVVNLKITYPNDLELFKILCKSYFFNEEDSQ